MKRRDEEMAAHSSVLAWRIPGTGEPGGLPSMGSHRVGRGGFLPRHDEDLREPLVRRQGSQVSMRVASPEGTTVFSLKSSY